MSEQPKIGETIQDFTLVATGEQSISLSQFTGQSIVLYFYPRDSTPGCTTESENFRDLMPKFSAANTIILGVSRDSLTSHEKFKQKLGLPFELLVDDEERLCSYFDVIKEKNMYGKKVMGIERSTFLIDRAGVLQYEWRKVKVQGHAEAVLAQIQEMTSGQ